MCCVVKCIQRRNQVRVKNVDLCDPSCTVVMQRHKSASPFLSVLRFVIGEGIYRSAGNPLLREVWEPLPKN